MEAPIFLRPSFLFFKNVTCIHSTSTATATTFYSIARIACDPHCYIIGVRAILPITPLVGVALVYLLVVSVVVQVVDPIMNAGLSLQVRVAFRSGLHQWAFTLKCFAKTYGAKFGVTEELGKNDITAVVSVVYFDLHFVSLLMLIPIKPLTTISIYFSHKQTHRQNARKRRRSTLQF